MLKKTTEQFAQELSNKFNIQLTDFTLLTEYTGWDQPITFRCNRCGAKKTVTADSLLRKNKKKQHICRCYGYSQAWLDKIKMFQEWKNRQEDFFILEDFKSNLNNLLVKCKKCGAEQRRSIDSLINNQGCQVCVSKQGIKKTEQQFKLEMEQIYGTEYEILSEYNDSNTDILIKHTLCGKIYKAKPHNLLTKKGGLCPICKRISKGEKIIASYLEKNQIEFVTQKRIENIKHMPFDFYLPKYNLLIEYQGIQHFEPVDIFGGKKQFERQVQIDSIKKNTALNQGYDLFIITYKEFDLIDSLLVQRLSLNGSSNN